MGKRGGDSANKRGAHATTPSTYARQLYLLRFYLHHMKDPALASGAAVPSFHSQALLLDATCPFLIDGAAGNSMELLQPDIARAQGTNRRQLVLTSRSRASISLACLIRRLMCSRCTPLSAQMLLLACFFRRS